MSAFQHCSVSPAKHHNVAMHWRGCNTPTQQARRGEGQSPSPCFALFVCRPSQRHSTFPSGQLISQGADFSSGLWCVSPTPISNLFHCMPSSPCSFIYPSQAWPRLLVPATGCWRWRNSGAMVVSLTVYCWGKPPEHSGPHTTPHTSVHCPGPPCGSQIPHGAIPHDSAVQMYTATTRVL